MKWASPFEPAQLPGFHAERLPTDLDVEISYYDPPWGLVDFDVKAA